jgi:hypothetical protein
MTTATRSNLLVVAFDLAPYNKLARVHPGCLPSFLLFVSAIILGKNARPPVAAMVRSALLRAAGRGSIQPRRQRRPAVTTENTRSKAQRGGEEAPPESVAQPDPMVLQAGRGSKPCPGTGAPCPRRAHKLFRVYI